MHIYPIILLAVLNHTSFKGSKVLVSLYAIELGASPFAIGVLFSMYSIAPIVLAVHAGRLADRFGVRLPMLFGSAGLAAGLALPWFFRGLPALYVSAALMGSCYIFFIVSVQNLVGAIGTAEERPRNYSLYSLGVALSSFLGPLAAGFLIDWKGHAATYLAAALVPLVPIAVLSVRANLVPAAIPGKAAGSRGSIALLRENPALVRVLIISSVIETGLELFQFYMPIYGHSIGLSASVIGMVMSCYAVALLLVRLVMPVLVKRYRDEVVLSVSLLAAAVTYAVFPLVRDPLLLAALSFVLGLGLGCCSPLSMMLTFNRSPEGRSGEGMGLRQMTNKLTEALAPLTFGLVGSSLGMLPVFWSCALLLGGGGLALRRR